jgi:hypothetical protein
MKTWKTLLCAAVLGISTGAAANEGIVYECGSLLAPGGYLVNEFTSYSVEVADGLVVLRTTHGTKESISTTNSFMNLVSTRNESETYYASGITARFLTINHGRYIGNLLMISDRSGNSATCVMN